MNVLTHLVDYGIIGAAGCTQPMGIGRGVGTVALLSTCDAQSVREHSDYGNSPDKATGGHRNGGSQCALYRALGNRVGHHVDVPYDGHLRDDGGRCDYGGIKFGAQGDGYWVAGGDPMCGAQQYSSAARHRTAHAIQGAAWSVS